MYIGTTDAPRPAPPGLGARRQPHRRGDGRLSRPHRRHHPRRRSVDGRRQRPRHPGRQAHDSGKSALEVVHDRAARRRQVRRRRLQGLRRPARRRRERRQRALGRDARRGAPRRQAIWSQEYSRGTPTGSSQSRSAPTGPETAKERHARPPSSADPGDLRDDSTISSRPARQRFRESAYLTKGALDHAASTSGPTARRHFYFEGGIRAFVRHLNRSREPLLNRAVLRRARGRRRPASRSRCSTTTASPRTCSAFANNINTVDGGTHLTGFRSALTRVAERLRARKAGILQGRRTPT